MEARQAAPQPTPAPSRLSFAIFGGIALVMLASALASYMDHGRLVVETGILAFGGGGALVACVSLRKGR